MSKVTGSTLTWIKRETRKIGIETTRRIKIHRRKRSQKRHRIRRNKIFSAKFLNENSDVLLSPQSSRCNPMKAGRKDVIILFLVVVCGVVSGVALHRLFQGNTPVVINISKTMGLGKTFDIHLNMIAIRNGHVITRISEHKDPVLRNFYILVYDYLLGGRGSGKTISFVDTLGYLRSVMDTHSGGYDPYIVIQIGNGTNPVSPTDHALSNLLYENRTPTESIGENATHIYYNYTAEFFIDKNVNITEAGLALRNIDIESSSLASGTIVLIARELLDSAIQLVAGDYLIVSYTIYVKKSGNFVDGFYNLSHNYFFKTSSGPYLEFNDTSGVAHRYMDTESGGVNPKPSISIGNGYKAFTEDIYCLSSPISTKVADILYTLTNDNLTVNISAIFTFDADYQISEVGLIINVDSDIGDATSTCDILILYIPLDTSITVHAGQSLVFRITITFKFT